MQSHELEFFLTKNHAQQVGNDLFVGTQNSTSFTVDEGKGRLNPSRDKSPGKPRRRKVEKSCVTDSCVLPAGASTSLMFILNGMTKHTTHTLYSVSYSQYLSGWVKESHTRHSMSMRTVSTIGSIGLELMH